MFCDKCNCDFINLQLHKLLQHEKQKEYRCIFCGLHLKNGLELFEHISSNHTDVNIRCCHLCNVKCTDLDKHVECHDELKIYKCDVCSILFSSRNNYINHVCCRNIYKCRKCGQNFNNETDLNIHVEGHKKKTLCHCGQNCKNKCNLKENSLTNTEDFVSNQNTLGQHETPILNDFVCFNCGEKFNLKNLMQRHLRPKDCCDQKFPCKSLYKQHINSIPHSFKCEICDKSYTTSSSLLKHLHKSHPEHTAYIKGKFVCCICLKNFTTRSSAKRHHNDCLNRQKYKTPKISLKKSLKCDICDKDFKNERGLRYHMAGHNGAKTYKCDCGKSFITNYKLRQHLLTHTNRRDFKCGVCLERFKNKYTLKQHEMRHLKDLTCYHCNEKFSRKTTLKNHLRLYQCCNQNFQCYGLYIKHENSKKHIFECDICSKTYNTRSTLLRHTSDVHYEHTALLTGDYKCRICYRVFTTGHNAARHFRRNHS